MSNKTIASQEPALDCINKVNIIGSVVHKHRPRDNVIVLTVAVKGIAHESDYPNITFYGEKVAPDIDTAIDVGRNNYPRVEIEATIQTSRKETDSGTRFFQNIVGTKIHFASTNMERISGLKGIGTHKMESVNEVCVLGHLSRVYPIRKEGRENPIGVILTIRTKIDGRVNFPRVTCFTGVSRLLELNPGDIVCATAALETATKQRDGRTERYESVVATEVTKIEPEAQA